MKKKVILGIIIVLIIGFVVCFLLLNNKDEKKVNQFKEEYEKYNNVEVDNLKLLEVSINNEKEIKYLDVDGLKSFKTGIIFLGNSQDYKSRLIVESLLMAYDRTSVKELYYYSVEDIENVKTIAEYLNSVDAIPDVIYVKDGKFVSEVKWDLEEGIIDYPQPGSQEIKKLYKEYFNLFSSSLDTEECEDQDSKC